MDTPTDKQYPPLASGQTLGPDHHRFQLSESIGPHLFGELWEARDLSTQPTATVSLLILHPALLGDTGFINAFKKQQTLCKSLRHPHLAECYGYFPDRNGRLFIAYEKLEGLTLAQLLDSRQGRKLPVTQKRALLGQLALALEAGYQKLRQPHGALTPDQVFINRREGVKLLGFAGLETMRPAARLLPDIETTVSNYLAPEVEGPGRPDARADLYSLAVLAHRLLAGTLPWTSEADTREPERLSRPAKIEPRQWELITRALSPVVTERPAGIANWVRSLFSAEAAVEEARPDDTAAAAADATGAAEPAYVREDSPRPGGDAKAPPRRRLKLERPGWLKPAYLRSPAIFLAGLALGVWLGLWLGQRQLDESRAQLRDIAQQGAELRTALQALQSAQPSASATTESPATAASAAPPPGTDSSKNAELKAFRDELHSGGYGPEMLPLPTGSFLMGSDSRLADDNERPVQRIEIGHAVALARREVTFEEYDRFADATGRKRPDDGGWGRGTQPVINVSWHDAVAYARWLANESGQPYRLPSEAEWEYAARAGTTGPYWWGDDIGQGRAACDECGSDWDGRQPAPAGSFAANPWGFQDLNGNVEEWVADCYSSSHAGVPTNGTARRDGSCEYRVIRGGSWFDIGRLIRSSSRYRNPPGSHRESRGFRVAVDIAATDTARD